MGWPKTARIYPSQLKAFERIAQTKPPTKAQLKKLLNVPEVEVKNRFAAIIGEPFVPKDWGGEKSDLYTSRLTLDEKPISAAFIFKGPAVSGALHPANMGKRGDQLVRAFEEPADLIVIQHHNQIASTVIRQAEALAADHSRPRLYCIIDGAETYRILKTYRKF